MAPLPGRVSSTLQRHDIKLQRPLFFLAGAVLLFSARQGKGSIPEGRLAQLVEHLVYTERVSGSSPLPPTIFLKDFRFEALPALHEPQSP